MLPSSRRSTWAKAPAVAPGAAGRPGQTPLRRDVFTDIPSAANRRTPDLVPRRLGLAAKPLDAQQRQAALEAVRTGATLPARGGAAAPTRSVFAARPTTVRRARPSGVLKRSTAKNQVTVATEVGRYLPAKRDEPAAAAVRTSSPPRLSTAPPRHERENDAEQVEGRAALLRAPRSRAPPPQRACEVWLVRHGETEANAGRIAQGQQPGRLTRTGALQAAALGQRLRLENAQRPFDVVLCSDLLRCRQTCSLALAPWAGGTSGASGGAGGLVTATGRRPKVYFDALLRERSVGVYEGAAHDAPRPARPPGVPPREYRVPRGESWTDVNERAAELLRRIATTFVGRGAPPRILVVTHGGFIMETVNAARGADGVTQPFMSNGAINTAIYKLDVAPRDGAVCCRLTAANDAQHLMPPHLARFRAEAQHHGGAFDLEAELPPYDVEHTHEAWWAQDAPAPAASA